MQEIKFDVYGKIQRGDYEGWYMKVIDDTKGTTGGFYIILERDISDAKAEGYNSWLETFEDVVKYCEEANWVIDWKIEAN